MFFPLALCVTGGAEQENQLIFTDPLRQAILDSLYFAAFGMGEWNKIRQCHSPNLALQFASLLGTWHPILSTPFRCPLPRSSLTCAFPEWPLWCSRFRQSCLSWFVLDYPWFVLLRLKTLFREHFDSYLNTRDAFFDRESVKCKSS